jgi:hypothetical protein
MLVSNGTHKPLGVTSLPHTPFQLRGYSRRTRPLSLNPGSRKPAPPNDMHFRRWIGWSCVGHQKFPPEYWTTPPWISIGPRLLLESQLPT